MIDIMLKNLLTQAKRVSATTVKLPKYMKYSVIFITETGTYDTLGVDGLEENGDFVSNHSEDTMISVRMQPSLYYDVLLANRDDLKAQLIATDGEQRYITEYVAIPLEGGDPRTSGEHSMSADIDSVSFTSLNSYQFQLLDPIYAKLRDGIVSGISLMGNVEDTVAHLMNVYTSQLVEPTEFEGIVFDYPIDNQTRYSSIVVPEGVELPSLPSYIQNNDKYGFYREGLGTYFQDKKWWIYSLFNSTKFDDHPLVAEIIRLPRDKFPTLEDTYFNDENGLTVLATGDSNFEDDSDIIAQDEGVGARLVAATKVSGETGTHYNAGRSIQSRADSMLEFQLVERKSGQEYYPVGKTPTNNPFKYASVIAGNAGDILSLDWDNSDTSTITPGMPCRYQYMAQEKMYARKGVILGFRTRYTTYNKMTLFMSRTTTLVMYLEKTTTEVT